MGPEVACTGSQKRSSRLDSSGEILMKIRTYAATLGLLLALIGFANAQIFPDRTLTMVIPFAAGGPTDVLGRVMAQRMGEILGQTVIVENIGGAGGMNGRKKGAGPQPEC